MGIIFSLFDSRRRLDFLCMFITALHYKPSKLSCVVTGNPKYLLTIVRCCSISGKGYVFNITEMPKVRPLGTYMQF